MAEKPEYDSAVKKDEMKKEAEAKKEVSKSQEKTIDGEKQKILEMSEISIWLDNYDDIFSDFDPRPYSQRSLSDDFLLEARKVSSGKTGEKLELRFLIPEQQRSPKDEFTIRKRLRDHFLKHAKLLRSEMSAMKKRSFLLIFLGLLMMLGATYVYSYQPDTFTFRFLFVLLEPAGWFTTWFALDRLFYSVESKKSEYGFYEKMTKCEIIFSSY